MPHARITDPSTSHEAARSLTAERLSETQRAILELLAKHPMADDEIGFRHYAIASGGRWNHASPSGLRSRRAELVQMGLVVRHSTDTTKFGRKQIVWALA